MRHPVDIHGLSCASLWESVFSSNVLESEAWSNPSDAMSATERYEDDIQKATELYKIAKQNGSMEATRAMLGAGIGSGILPDGNPLGLHLVMFIPTLMGQVQPLCRAGGSFVTLPQNVFNKLNKLQTWAA